MGDPIGAFVSVFGSTLLLALVFIALFFLLRSALPFFYQPRRSLYRLRRRPPRPAGGAWGLLRTLWRMRERDLLRTNGMDAVVALRVNKLAMRLLAVAALYGWLVLIPVNATSPA
jgi:hypothetical protein